MTTTPEFLQQLRKTSLFREFTEDEICSCLDLLDRQQAKPEECIVRQDELGDSMYLIVEGRARVLRHDNGRTVELAELVPGDFFGEIALVDEGPRSADVEAMTECTLFRITQATISALAGVYPTVAFKFLIAVGRVLVERMRQTNRRYVDSLLFPVGSSLK